MELITDIIRCANLFWGISMKIKMLKEEYDWDNFLKHLKHILEYKNDSRFAKIVSMVEGQLKVFKNKLDSVADTLARSEAGSAFSDDAIVGYIQKDGRYVKYDKDTNDFLVYVLKGNPKNPRYVTISIHKKTLDQYNKIAQRDFLDELPNNKDNNN